MPKLRITNPTIKAHTTGERVELWDTVVAGLHLLITPGGAATYYVKYRAAGVQRKVKLGTTAALSADEARSEAKKVVGAVAKGADPQAAKQADRQALRMVDLFGDDTHDGWYLATYVKTAGKLGTAKTDKGIANDRYAIAKHLRSRRALMSKRVADVTVADLNRIKADLPASAWRKLRNILVVGFRHAEESGSLPAGSNPAARTRAATDAKRERYLTPEERQALEAALQTAAQIGPEAKGVARGTRGGLSPHLVRAIRLLALTGMRRGDVLALRWEWIDWQRGLIKLPTSKTGARDVPLTPQALAYLKRQKGTVARVGLVCCTTEGKPIHPENVERAWQSVRELAKLDGRDGKPAARLHDLRHSWASDAVSAGVPLYVVGAVLGHRVPTTTARYAHLHDHAVRAGVKAAGAAIERATSGRARA